MKTVFGLLLLLLNYFPFVYRLILQSRNDRNKTSQMMVASHTSFVRMWRNIRYWKLRKCWRKINGSNYFLVLWWNRQMWFWNHNWKWWTTLLKKKTCVGRKKLLLSRKSALGEIRGFSLQIQKTSNKQLNTKSACKYWGFVINHFAKYSTFPLIHTFIITLTIFTNFMFYRYLILYTSH